MRLRKEKTKEETTTETAPAEEPQENPPEIRWGDQEQYYIGIAIYNELQAIKELLNEIKNQ